MKQIIPTALDKILILIMKRYLPVIKPWVEVKKYDRCVGVAQVWFRHEFRADKMNITNRRIEILDRLLLTRQKKWRC